MDTLSEAKSERMYSWWWDSHISPKNSRWLQDNLTDLDSNIKWMIKLIEDQDADTFALRAEMYYKKRPELMKVVEEFYRAYRALAERYDHATGALRQAHRTMSKVCPNQFPSVLPDDSPANSFSEADPRTPEMSTPGRAFFVFDAAKKNGTFTEESNSKKGLKFAEGRVRKGLNFHEAVESEQVDKYEKEILVLKETLAKLEAEKEAVVTQYQQSLKSLSKLEAEVSRAQEDSRELREEARRAEAESQALKENLSSLEAEKEASLLQYQLCLEKIYKLEDILSDAEKDCRDLDERANKAETEAQILKQDLAKIEDEKDSVFNQYKQSSEMISDLENKLLLAENSAQKYSERAEMAEGEVETLKLAISKLNEERETMVLKMGSQSQEITEKQKELGRLWASIQEEWLRFMEAETAFPTLQLLHSRAQDELRSLASELQNKGQLLRDVEIRNGSLYDEILKLKEENKSVNELNFSSTISMKGMQNEIFSLRETNWKLEEENAHLENSLSQSAIALEITQQRLKDLEKTFAELEEKYSALEKEKKFTITEVEEVKVYLEEQKQEHVNLAQTSAIYLAGLETQVHFLQEENWKKNREFEGEFDKSMEAKMEIFVLKRCIQDLGEKHSCLLVEFQKLLYKSRMSEKLISELEQANVEKQLEVKSLFHLGKEKEFLGEVCRSLEIELRHLHDNYIMIKNREKCLSSKMQRKNDEIAMWETRGTIAQTLFEEKVVELLEKCKSLQDGNSSKDVKIDLLVKKIGVLEGENEKLKAQLVPYGPAVTSLMDSISYLEKHTLSHTNLQNSSSEEVKEAELGNYEPVTNHPSDYQNAMVSDAFADMHNLQARVKVIENSLIEMKRLRGNVKPASEISEVGPKDIMLDHMSEHSSYGIRRRYYVGPDNQMLELWETTEQDSSIDLTVGKGKQRPEAIKHKSGYYYSDFLSEKELGVDDLEISKKFAEARHEGNKRKVLERLNSDVQKLTNLQITVQDLKRKVEIMDKGRKGKAIIESENMKWKLEEAEVAIGKLFDQNGKVMKNVEDNYGKKPTMGSEESGSVRRRRISEQARRVSEKIGRLQLEIQRVQFDLVKLGDENENKGKIRVTETKRRVLLRDFIYGGRPRKNPRPTRKKKTPFCACMEPPTRGD